MKADYIPGIAKGGLYPPIERTTLTTIAAMAASVSLCADEKLTVFLELELAVRSIAYHESISW